MLKMKKLVAMLLCGLLAVGSFATLTSCNLFSSEESSKEQSSSTGNDDNSSTGNGDNSSTGNDDNSSTGNDDNSSTGNEDDGNDAPVVKDYYLEAENIDLSYVVGGQTSATPSGADLIVDQADARGGKMIFSLYVTDLFIEFEFESDVEVEDAVLSFGFMASFHDFTITDEEFQIYVNPELDDEYYPVDTNTRLRYSELSISTDGIKEYQITTTMHIQEGTNTVYLWVKNDDSLYPTASTMNAKAPDIDYMKISTTATITHTTYEN